MAAGAAGASASAANAIWQNEPETHISEASVLNPSRQNENRQNEPEPTLPTRAQMLKEIRQADPRILLQAMRDVLPAEAMETLFNNTKEAA